MSSFGVAGVLIEDAAAEDGGGQRLLYLRTDGNVSAPTLACQEVRVPVGMGIHEALSAAFAFWRELYEAEGGSS